MVAKSETGRNRFLQFAPPRGVRLYAIPARPNRPFGVQWAVDGRTKTKTFSSEDDQLAFARELTAGAQEIGLDAYRLDPAEAREWRAFRARIGPQIPLDAIAVCWERHGRHGAAMTVSEAVTAYLAAKRSEGLSAATLAHYGPVYNRLMARLGDQAINAVSPAQIGIWLNSLEMAVESRRTHTKRVRGLFEWLRINRYIADNPAEGIKPPKAVQDDVAVLTVEQVRRLFEASADGERETYGRLALEAFCGLRFGSAAVVNGAADVSFSERGITLPAHKIKTRRRQFIDGLPDNLWHWLEWSSPSEWKMTPRQYLTAKSAAFVRAEIPHPHNCLRHSFGTYHMAQNKDASKTAAILCHTAPKMLYAHYKGRATESDGRRYFEIYPTGAASVIKSSSES